MFSIIAATDWLPSLGEQNVWWLLVLSGTAALAITVLLLARLNWFQSRRISTCVVLSVIAHVLLVTTAYFAKVIDEPPVPGDGAIRVSLAMPTEPNELHEQHVVDDEQPWDQIPDNAIHEPEISDGAAAEVELDAFSSLLDTDILDTGGSTVTELVPRDIAESVVQEEQLAELADAADASLREPLDAAEMPDDLTTTPTENASTQQENQFSGHELPRTVEPPTEPSADVLSSITDQLDETGDTDATPLIDTAEPEIVPPPTRNQDAADPAVEEQLVAQGTPTAPSSTPTSEGWKHVSHPDVPERYRLRISHQRLREIQPRGGSADTEAAVKAALVWLANHQEADGRWDASLHGAGVDHAVDGHFRRGAGRDADTGITGLALLAFLSAGHTHQRGEHRAVVGRGLEYLTRSQQADGCLRGPARAFAQMYCHGIATLAMSEALAMTSDDRLRPYVDRAVRYTLHSQDRSTGGWRYWPGERGDTSQFGWQVMALVSAKQAGINIPHPHWSLLERFLNSVSSGYAGGLAAYRAGHPPKRSMTAEALVCRVFLDHNRDPRCLSEATGYISQLTPASGPMNLYYWYYATLGLYQVSDGHWEPWNKALQSRLLNTQRPHGDLAGSWDPRTVWGGYGGRVYATAMATLCLEVYYRYLPIHSDHVAGRQFGQ